MKPLGPCIYEALTERAPCAQKPPFCSGLMFLSPGFNLDWGTEDPTFIMLCTVMSSSDVLLRQAMWRSQCPKRVQDAKSGRISPHFSTHIVCSFKSSQDVLRSRPGGFSRGKVRSLFSWLHISRVQAGLAHWKFFGLWQILPHLQHAWLLAHPGCSSFSCLV